MSFNERCHAFIIATFYKNLKESSISCWESVFVKAVQKYGQERGHRMALRALRDSRELNYVTYEEYGEWMESSDSEFDIEVVSIKPDNHIKIHLCPWNNQFKEMRLNDCGKLYCSNIDKSIVRGFNPNLKFENLALFSDDKSCEMIFEGADLQGVVINKNNFKDFEFHCAHVFSTFSRVINNVYGRNALGILDNIVGDFAKKYGVFMLDRILSYVNVDFNSISNKKLEK